MPSQDIKPCVQDPITQFLEKQVNRYMLLSNLQRAGKAPPERTCSEHLLPPSGEGVVWRGEGRLSFQLRCCDPPRPPHQGLSSRPQRMEVSAWVSFTCVSGHFSHFESFAFILHSSMQFCLTASVF